VNAGCADDILSALGFVKFGFFIGRPSWTVWQASEVPALYLVIHREGSGQFVEAYYVWRDKPYGEDSVVRAG
jgi:hypothetical protein